MIHLRLTSGGIDSAPCGTLVLGLFEGERPPEGEAGWADWRMAGTLSRAILAGHVTAAPGMTLLMPPGKLPTSRVLLLGLGQGLEFRGRELGQALELAIAKLAGLAETNFAVALPGTKRWPYPRDAADIVGMHLLGALAATWAEAWITLHGPPEHLTKVKERLRLGGRSVARQIQLHEEFAAEGRSS